MADIKVLRKYGNQRRENEEDGAEWVFLPTPDFRKVHRLGGEWARGGRYNISITEVRYPSTAMLVITETDNNSMWVAVEYLSGMVQLYLSDRWTLLHLTSSEATFKKDYSSCQSTNMG